MMISRILRGVSVCLPAVAVALIVTAPRAQALDVKAAQSALLKTPMMKGFKLHEFKTSGKNFTIKLGTKKVPAIVFNTGTEKAPIWNVGLYPKSLKLGPAYKTGGGVVLGGITLSNPAIVLAAKQSSKLLKDLPKTVQAGIKKVFGSKMKSTAKITYPAGVNFSFTLDISKTPGLNLLKPTLGVVDTKVAMAGHMGMDLIRYILNGKANSQPSDLAKVSMTAVLKGIKPPKIGKYVNAKNMVARFVANKSGQVTLYGQTTLSVLIGKQKVDFATAMTFEPKAKGPDANLITITGTTKKIPKTFGGQTLKSMKLTSRVTGEKKLMVGFAGQVLIGKKPATFAADLSFAKLPPQPTLSVTTNLSVDDVAGVTIPGIGGLAFKNAQFSPDYVSGTIAFRGIDTTASVLRSGNKKPVLALLHKTFDVGAYLPGVKGSPLDQAAMRDVAMVIVPKGSALKAVAAKDLPGPTGETITAAIGATAKFQLNDGVNLIGAIDVKKSGIIKDLLAKVGISRTTLPFAGKVSTEILRNAKLPSKQGVKDKVKEILASLDIGAAIPVPKIPGVSKIITVSKPSFHIMGVEDEDTQELKLTTVIKGTFGLNLPGKKLSTGGSLKLMKGTGKAIGIGIDSTSKIGWKKAFGIPFLTLNNIGMAGEIEDDGKGGRSFKLALKSDVQLGAQKLTSETNLVIENGAIVDIGLSIPGTVEMSKLPGLGKIPGIKEFAFKDMTIGLAAISGAVTWKRLGVTTQATLMQVNGQYAAFFRVKDMKLGTLAKGVPEPFASIKFPATALAFANQDLSDLTLADLPAPMKSILEGIVTKPTGKVPVFDGVTLIGALSDRDFPAPLRKMVKEIGVFDSLDGPLILSGGINGVFSGVPKIGLYGSLPGLNLPKNQPLSRVVSFDKAKADFFVRADVASTVFQLGAGGDLTIRVPHLVNPKKVDKLTFRGELYANVDLVSVAGSFKVGGTMQGKWRNPLGFDNFAFENPAFVVGVDTEGSVEFGIGGTAEFAARNNQKLRYAADFVTNINFSSTFPIPKKLGVRLKAKKTGYMAMAEISDAMMRGVLTGPMASVVTKLLPDPASRKTAQFLQSELKKKSLIDILQLDKLPLPILQAKDVDLYFATPGAIIPGREDTLNGIGMVVAGKAELLLMGKTTRLAEIDTRLTVKDGLKIYGKLPAVQLGPLKLSSPVIDVAANVKALPHFKLKGGAKLLGASEKLDIELSKDKIAFFYDKNLGPVVKLRVDARTVGKDLFRAKDFVVKASAKTSIDEVITKEVLPRFGIPKAVGELIAGMNPLFIDGGSFEGSLTNFVKGNPVLLTLEHKIFGKRVAPAVIELRPVWKDPLSAFPAIPIARELNKSFLIYLATNPIDMKPVNLGLIKIEKAKMTALITNINDPKFVISGKTSFLGASRAVDVALSDKGYAFRVKDKIAGGLWDSDFRAWTVGGTALAPNDIKYWGRVDSDFEKWLRQQVGKNMNKGFDGINRGYQAGIQGLKDAEAKVRGLDRIIGIKRNEARRDLNNLRSLISHAKRYMDHTRWLMDRAYGSHRYYVRRHAEERRGAFWPHEWIRVGVLWGLREGSWVSWRASQGIYHAAQASFRAIDAGLAAVPIDLHPKVAPLIVARTLAIGALQTARLVLNGAQHLNATFKKVTNDLVNAVAGARVLVVKKATFQGSVRETSSRFFILGDVMGQQNVTLKMNINLLQPWKTDLRALTAVVTSMVKGERVNLQREAIPAPPELPIAIVSKKDIANAVVAAIRAKASLAAAAKAKQEQAKQAALLASLPSSAPTGLNWKKYPSNPLKDVAVGANGAVWAIEQGGGNKIVRLEPASPTGWWDSGGRDGSKITVDGRGNPWIVTENNQIWHHDGRVWKNIPGAGRDIAAAGDGSIWVIGNEKIGNDWGIWRSDNGRNFKQMSGNSTRLAGGPGARVIAGDKSGNVHFWTGSGWGHANCCAADVAMAGNGAMWILGTDKNVWAWEGGTWRKKSGAGLAISADRSGRPMVVGTDRGFWYSDPKILANAAVAVAKARPGRADPTFRNMYVSANNNAVCLDTWPRGGALGAIPCQAHPNLRFTFWSDGTVRHDPEDRCLNVQRSGAHGAPVVVTGCGTHSDQQWQIKWSGGRGPTGVDPTWRFRIVHTASGRCLEAAGGRARTVNCGGSDNANSWPTSQTWRAGKTPPGPAVSGTNLSQGKPSRQSSVYSALTPSGRAVDGSTAGDGEAVNAITQLQQNAWWQVDLGNHYKINDIVIYNRGDGVGNRLNGAHVIVSDRILDGNAIPSGSGIARQSLGTAQARNQLKFGGKSGRFIRVQLPGRNYLQLAEVQVYGNPTPVRAPSYEASTFVNAQLVNAASGQCADENSGKLTAGGPVIMWGCNGSGTARDRQLWSHAGNGQIKTTNGLCLDVQSPNVRRGIPIIIWGCNGGGAPMQRQRWRTLADGRIQHIQSGMCLDSTNNANQRGRLVLSTCSTTATQKWRPRGVSS